VPARIRSGGGDTGLLGCWVLFAGPVGMTGLLWLPGFFGGGLRDGASGIRISRSVGDAGLARSRPLFAGGGSLGFSALVSALPWWCRIFAAIFGVGGLGGLHGFGISGFFVDFARGHAFVGGLDFGG
jgi:hypothetical protein